MRFFSLFPGTVWLVLFFSISHVARAQVGHGDLIYLRNNGSIDNPRLNAYIAEDFTNCGTGIKDTLGNWIVQPIYTHIAYLGGTYFRVFLGEANGIIDATGKTIVPPIYYSINRMRRGSEPVFLVENFKRREGVIDTTGKILVPIVWRTVLFYLDGTIATSNNGKKWTFHPLHGDPFPLSMKLTGSPRERDDSLFIVEKTLFSLDWWWLPSRYGMIDNHGTTVYKRKHRYIDYSRGKYNLVRIQLKHKVVYCTREGKTVWEAQDDKYSWESTYDDYYPYRSSLSVNSNGYIIAKINGKWGIMGAMGDTIVPFIYDDIDERRYDATNAASRNYLYLSNDTATGIYDAPNRTWIIPPYYQAIDLLTSYTNPSDSSMVLLYKVWMNERAGLVTSAGQVIVPILYRDIDYAGGDTYIFSNADTAIAVSLPQSTYSGGWLHSYDSYYSHGNSSAVRSIPADNRFAVKTLPNGTQLFYTPALVHDSAQLELYTLDDTRINEGLYHPNHVTYDSLLHATAVVVMPLQRMPGFRSGAMYFFPKTGLRLRSDEPDSLFYYSPSGKPGAERYDADLVTSDRQYKYYRYSSAYSYRRRYGYRQRLGLVRNDGVQLVRPGAATAISVDGYDDHPLFIVTAWRSQKQGVVDGNGQLLCDTVWEDIQSVDVDYAIISYRRWIRHIPFVWAPDKSNVLDMHTGKLLLSKKREPHVISFLGDHAFITRQKEGPLLFNLHDRRFVNGKGYMDMRTMGSGNYYAVKTCSAKMGIMDPNGKLVSDTMWTAMMYANYYLERGKGLKSIRYYVFYNDTAHIYFDATTGALLPDKEAAALLLPCAVANVDLDTAGRITLDETNCPGLLLDSVGSLDKVPVWAQQVLVDSLFLPVRYFPDTGYWYKGSRCVYCSKKQLFLYDWTKDYDRYSYAHFLSYSSDSCLSVYRARATYDLNRKSVRPDLFFTTMLFADGPHPVQLDSLFKGAEWKSFLIDEVLNYLNTTKDVEGQCSNPFMFPLMMRDRFLITKEGLLLYPPSYTIHYQPVTILLSWEKLKPYLRDDVKSKLGVK